MAIQKRLHITPEGPKLCSAHERPCKYGGENGTENHYTSRAEAQAAYEKSLEEEHDLLAKSSKSLLLGHNNSIRKQEEHYATQEEAQEAYERSLKTRNRVLPQMVKNSQKAPAPARESLTAHRNACTTLSTALFEKRKEVQRLTEAGEEAQKQEAELQKLQASYDEALQGYRKLKEDYDARTTHYRATSGGYTLKLSSGPADDDPEKPAAQVIIYPTSPEGEGSALPLMGYRPEGGTGSHFVLSTPGEEAVSVSTLRERQAALSHGVQVARRLEAAYDPEARTFDQKELDKVAMERPMPAWPAEVVGVKVVEEPSLTEARAVAKYSSVVEIDGRRYHLSMTDGGPKREHQARRQPRYQFVTFKEEVPEGSTALPTLYDSHATTESRGGEVAVHLPAARELPVQEAASVADEYARTADRAEALSKHLTAFTKEGNSRLIAYRKSLGLS